MTCRLSWLQDMIKQSTKAKVAHSELKKALDGMLKVLKNLNDSLHVVGLKGFPVSWFNSTSTCSA